VETTSQATIEELIISLIVGAILGTMLTVVLGMIGAAVYMLGPLCVCGLVMPVYWLLAAIGGTVNTLSWIPLGALIGATGSLYTLHRSKGVPKQLLYAIGGILLAFGLAALAFPLASSGYRDRTAIAERYTQFYDGYNNGEYEKAYSFMSPAYRQTHTIEKFKSDFDFLGSSNEQLRPGHSIRFSNNKAYLYPTDQWWKIGLLGSGYEFELEKVEGNWYFTGEYNLLLD
jgi:hypothetical protein